MQATELFLFASSCFGLSYVLGHAVITKGIRAWLWGGDWLFCSNCARQIDISTAENEGRSAGSPCPVCRAPLTEPIRLSRILVVLLECPACSGFWIALGDSLRSEE